jgi:preprotein translocase subunit SecG
MNILIGFLLVVHVIVCVFIILLVLMQRPKSEGLGTAFGGGVTDTLFGSGAGNVLTKLTTWLGFIFFATTITLALLYGSNRSSKSLSTLVPTPAPAAVTNAVPVNPQSSPIIPAPAPAPTPAPKAPEKAPESAPK